MSIQRSSSKTLVDIGRALLSSASEENRDATLPRVNTKKQIAGTQDSYNFANKNTHRDSLSALVTKESLSALSNHGKTLTDDLSRKLEESRKELDVRNQNVFAIQRNYDGLSAMLKKEKDLGVENKRKVSALSDDNAKLSEENRHLTRRIEDMIERLKKYEHEAEIGQKERSRASQSIEEINLLRGKLQELQFQFEKKKKEAAELENRNKSLLSQIDKYKSTASNSEEDKQKGLLQLKELRNDLLITQTENDRLHKIIVEYKIKMTDLEKMRGEYESIASYKLEMDKENRDLRKEVTSLRNDINNLKISNKKLEDSNHSLTVQMKIISDKEEGYKQEIERLQNSLNSALDEVSQKSVKIQELQTSLNEEHLRFLKYHSVVTSYDQILTDGGEPLMIKKSEYSLLKTDLTRYKEKTHDYDEMKRKLDKLIKDVDRKDAQIDQYVADKEFDTDRNKKLAERVRVLEEENKRYAAHSQKLQNALDYKNKNDGLKEGFFNGEIESLKQKLDSNISNLGDINFKQKSAAAEKEQLFKQIDTLKKDLAIKTKENADLKKEFQDLKKKMDENDVEKLGHEILTLRGQLNKLYDLQKVSYNQIEELKSQLEKKDKRIAELGENQYKERMTQLEEREGQINKAIAKIDHCQSSLIISLACTECMGSMKNPITMVPCGHSYCEKCLPKTPYCNECGEKKGNAQATLRNRLLDEVIAKVAYNQVILENMKPKTTPTK